MISLCLTESVNLLTSRYPVAPCRFVNSISVYGFYSNFNRLYVLQKDVAELMIKAININNILKRRILVEYIMRTKRQRISADTVIIIADQKIFCSTFIFNDKSSAFQNLDLLLYAPEHIFRHNYPLIKQNAPECAYHLQKKMTEARGRC